MCVSLYHVCVISASKYVVPTTWHQMLGTKCLVRSTYSAWYQALGKNTWCQVLATKGLVPLAPSAWYQILGCRYLVSSIWWVWLELTSIVSVIGQVFEQNRLPWLTTYFVDSISCYFYTHLFDGWTGREGVGIIYIAVVPTIPPKLSRSSRQILPKSKK